MDARRQRRTNNQRERRQAWSSSQRAECLAQRRANYHARRQSRNMSLDGINRTDQLQTIPGNLLITVSNREKKTNTYRVHIVI